MLKSKVTMTISCIAAMVPLLVYLYLYSAIPDFVPIHYDGATADRFVVKSSWEVILLSGLGWLGLILMKLLRLVLQKILFRSYVENLAAASRIYNAATLLVTVLFSVISTYALISMV